MAKMPWYFKNVKTISKNGQIFMEFDVPWYGQLILLIKLLWRKGESKSN